MQPSTPLEYQKVFVPGGYPHYTYNPRTALKLEGRLDELNHNLCKLATVTGQSKVRQDSACTEGTCHLRT